MRPIKGAFAAVGERVTFARGGESFTALNEDAEPFGKVPKRYAAELSLLVEKGYRAEVAGREDGVLTVEVTADEAEPRREQFRLTIHPKSKDEKKHAAALAPHSRVYFWEGFSKFEVLDPEGYALGKVSSTDYHRVATAHSRAYRATATLKKDGSLSVWVSYVAKNDRAETKAEAPAAAVATIATESAVAGPLTAPATDEVAAAVAEAIEVESDTAEAATAADAAGAAAAETAAAATETANLASEEDEVGSTRMSLDVTAYPQNLKQKERIDALPAASDVFFKDEEVIVVVDSQGEKLGALTLDESQSARVAASGDYEAKATPNGNGSLDVAISYSSTTKGEEGAGAVEAGGDASALAKLSELLGKVPLKFLVAGGVVIVLALLLVLLAASRSCALGNHNYEATETVEPTCTVKGYTVYTCSRCDDTYKDDYVAPLGHDLEATETVEATCTEDGYTVYTCSRCGYTYEDDAVDALGHTIEEWSVDKEATCTETGSKSGTCTVCGETITETIAKTEHTEGSWETVAEPSVSVSGNSVSVIPGEKQLTCSVCGEVLETQEIDMEIGDVYTAGSYRVGTDIPAGEYKIFCSSSSEAYYCVYSDTSQEDILDNDNFSECAYIKVSSGQLLVVKRAVFVSVDDAWPTTDLVGSGVYKVGLDLEAGEYEVVAYSGEQGYWCVWNSADAETRNIVSNDIFEGTTYITVREGQYLEVSRASADKTD